MVLGCNIYRDFVIVNESKESITIEYDLLYTTIGDENRGNVMSIEEFDSNKSEWRSLSPADYVIDKENNKISAKIAPNQVFRINTVDVEKLERYWDVKFRIKELVIKGKYGEITLKGDQVFNNFKQEFRYWSPFEKDYPTYIYYYK